MDKTKTKTFLRNATLMAKIEEICFISVLVYTFVNV